MKKRWSPWARRAGGRIAVAGLRARSLLWGAAALAGSPLSKSAASMLKLIFVSHQLLMLYTVSVAMFGWAGALDFRAGWTPGWVLAAMSGWSGASITIALLASLLASLMALGAAFTLTSLGFAAGGEISAKRAKLTADQARARAEAEQISAVARRVEGGARRSSRL